MIINCANDVMCFLKSKGKSMLQRKKNLKFIKLHTPPRHPKNERNNKKILNKKR